MLKHLEIDIDKFFSCVKNTLVNLWIHVRDNVLFGIQTDFKLPIVDSQDEKTLGRSVFGPPDETLGNLDSAAFLGALLKDGKLCHRRPDGKIVWDFPKVSRWLADIHRSWSDIYSLMHMLSLSGRGAEEALYQWTNSPDGRRHLLLVKGVMSIISNYRKGHQITGLYKQILRLMPNDLGILVGILLRVVRPIEITTVATFFTPTCQRSRMKKLYSKRIFVSYGKEWSGQKLSLLLKTWWMKNMNLPIGLNLHRQFAIGLQREFVSYPRNDPRKLAAQEAFGHGEQADEMNYARKRGDSSIPLSRQTLFETVCKDWLCLFGFPDPKAYRSLWDDTDIYQQTDPSLAHAIDTQLQVVTSI
jgi:hypothetical protein